MPTQRRSLPLTLLAVTLAFESAAAPLSLQLADEAGLPIAHAVVEILGTSESATADGSGRCVVEAPDEAFEIAVTGEDGGFLGTAVVEGGGAAGVSVVLPRAAVDEEVTVTAAGIESIAPAASVAAIDATELARRAPARIADALAGVAGAERIGEGLSAVPSIRGMARGRVLLLLDDARVTSERRAGASASFVDPFVLEGVEIVRGPGSVAHGSDAIGGILHARTRQPDPSAPAFAWEARGGSGLRQAGAGFSANVPVGEGAVLAMVHARRFDDWDAPHGRVANSGGSDEGALVSWLLPTGTGSVHATLQADEATRVGKPSSDIAEQRTWYPLERSVRFGAGADLGPVAFLDAVELDVSFGRQRIDTSRDRFATASRGRQLSEATVSATDAGLRAIGLKRWRRGYARFGVDTSGRFGMRASSTYRKWSLGDAESEDSKEVAVGSARRLDIGILGETEWTLPGDRVLLAAGLRGDDVRTSASGGSLGKHGTRESAPSGYAAVTVSLAKRWSVVLQRSRGFRDPLLSDRYYRGISGRGHVIGEPGLDPETSDQWDLTLRGRAGSAEVVLGAYEYRIHDLIERYRDGDDFRFRNRGQELLRGAELEVASPLGERFRASGSLAWARGEITEDGSAPDDVPAATARGRLDWTSRRGTWATLLATYQRRDDRPGPTETATPGRFLLDLSAGVPLGRRLELRGSVVNVLDRSYPASADELAVEAPGRSFELTLAGRF